MGTGLRCRATGILGAVGSSAAAAPVSGPDEPAVPAMLGRQREVAVVTALLDRAAAGSGAALLLHGEPGIGKTTLLAEAQRLAARGEEAAARRRGGSRGPGAVRRAAPALAAGPRAGGRAARGTARPAARGARPGRARPGRPVPGGAGRARNPPRCAA